MTNSQSGEIYLIDYFRVLWKRKYLIVLGSLLPALVVGLILFFSSRNYTITYVYDVKDQGIYDVKDQSLYDVSNWNLDEKTYNVLLDWFYDAENTDRIATKLEANGLNRYAKLISTAGTREDLKQLVSFEVLPPYMGLFKVKVEAADTDKLEQIRQLNAQLLKVTIVAGPKKDIREISLVIRDNIENVIPVYSAEEGIIDTIRGYKAEMASIEKNRFDLELVLRTNKAVLAKLKNIKIGALDKNQGNITLQFDVGDRSEYLPLEYQIQATESKIIELEGQVAASEEKYAYYKDLLALNGKLLAELKKNTSSHYTIQHFHSFLIDLVDGYKNKELKDYLSSYIKKIENRISVSAPVTERPKVSPVPRSVTKKSTIVFAICLMISVFAAFLSEGIEKGQAQAS
ncbi:MAG: hypothetical protein ACYS9C_03060 [Planctomycetota bacterium]|jgi:hypothetical protein